MVLAGFCLTRRPLQEACWGPTLVESENSAALPQAPQRILRHRLAEWHRLGDVTWGVSEMMGLGQKYWGVRILFRDRERVLHARHRNFGNPRLRTVGLLLRLLSVAKGHAAVRI